MTAKPTKTIVTREQTALWSTATHIIQEKADGVFMVKQLKGDHFVAAVAGEWVTRKSGQFLSPTMRRMLAQEPSGYFVAFDVLSIDGEDFTSEPAIQRWQELLNLAPLFPSEWSLIPAALEQSASAFVKSVLDSGGEGIVAKRINAPYSEPMACLKVLETRECIITQTGGSQSVGIAEMVGGHGLVDRGRIKLGGGKCDKVRAGSIIKVESMGLTDNGLLREPRLCQDTETW